MGTWAVIYKEYTCYALTYIIMKTHVVVDSGSVYSFGSDYYGCLGCDNQEGDEVCTPVLIDFFSTKPVAQVGCKSNLI